MSSLAYRARAYELAAHGCITAERACTGKVQYLTKSDARKAANEIEKKERRNGRERELHTYKCPWCSLHHLASNDEGTPR